ncbi:hypothetical protein DSM112329_00131 [Paraconexibacter sp. AEG42_29]|uniref:Bacterial Ig-like domain-containing protein n=1 Tax=Paraconexibacter sp. AEG42_29 TaxID=2997339 RepID=A0AAU7APM5_9ACTN
MNRSLRLIVLLTACSAGLALPAGASARIVAPKITEPANAFAPVFYDLDGTTGRGITVAGTVAPGASDGEKLDIVCLRRGEGRRPAPAPGAVGADTVAAGVAVRVPQPGSAGTFSVTASADSTAFVSPCRLLALTAGNSTVESDASGPSIYPSVLRDFVETAPGNPNAGQRYDVDASTVTAGLTSTAHIESFGGCGLWNARPLDPAVAPDKAALNVFECAGYADDVADGTSPTRSELQIDGRNAFTGAMAALGSGGLPGVAGRPALTRSGTRDPATGLLRLAESTDVVRCQTTPAGYPFTDPAECGGLVGTGVRLVRQVTMSEDGRSTTMRDRWESTDGADHILDLLLEVDFATQDYGIRVPWTGGGVTAYPGSASLPGPPSVPASIFVSSDRRVPDGDLAHATGAVSFSTAPSAVEFISGLGDPSRFMELRYIRSVTAAAPLELVHTFSMAPTAAESAALAGKAEDAFTGPRVAITSPAAGSTTALDTVTATGTASDDRSLASLIVNGLPVSTADDGSWSAPVALSPGANTIVARAIDSAGNATEASVAVTRVGAKRCVVPKVKGLKSVGVAITPLRKAGCRLGKVLTIYSKPKIVVKGKRRLKVTVKRFAVLGSKQKQGRRLAPGAAVDLIVQGRKPKAGARKPAVKKPKPGVKKPTPAAAKPKLPTYVPDLPAASRRR